MRECSGDGCGLKSGGAQVVGQGLALLSKARAHEAQEAGFFNSQLLEARGKSPAKDRGVYVWRRREGSGRQGEEALGRPVHLNGDREEAVVARAGLGNDAIGHLPLHHQNGTIEGGVAGCQLEQDLRGDAIGKVADDQQALACRRGGCREVELQRVPLDNRHALRREVHAQAEGKSVVEFDGQEMGGARSQGSGNRAAAGADFDDSAAGEIADGGRYALDGLGLVEEVLAELGFDGHGLS